MWLCGEIKMGDNDKKNVTLHLKSNLYNKYSDYCKKEGIVLSRQIEKFIEEELKKNGN